MQHYLGFPQKGIIRTAACRISTGRLGPLVISRVTPWVPECRFFAALQRAKPDLDSALRRGDLKPIRAWLQSHIWSKGFLSSPDLMRQATGETTNAEHFIRHIQKRYLD